MASETINTVSNVFFSIMISVWALIFVCYWFEINLIRILVNVFKLLGGKKYLLEKEIERYKTQITYYIHLIQNLQSELIVAQKRIKTLNAKYDAALDQIAKLKINNVYNSFTKRSSNSNDAMFTDEELKRIRLLCHPDRHGGKESAVKITAKLNNLLGK